MQLKIKNPKPSTDFSPDFSLENKYQGIVIGLDEAGRGPIAGPVVAACAWLDENDFPKGINDSKKLTKAARKKLFLELQKKSKFAIGVIDEKIIDQVNILQATKLAMLQAYENFCAKYKIFPEILLVDGNFQPFKAQDKIKKIIPVIKGDQKSLSIAAASIIAKETRDEMMSLMHLQYPQFGFDRHVGYPTRAHVAKVREYGICEIHRKSFEPIKSLYANS
jgi:ribonuclease HII